MSSAPPPRSPSVARDPTPRAPRHRGPGRDASGASDGARRRVLVAGGGPSGLTTALLLARAGHAVTVFERERVLGGLWACRLDDEGFFAAENSCKVFQPSYRAAPALFSTLGLRWQAHFTPRHELRRDWLEPFVADASVADLVKLGSSFVVHAAGLRSYRDVSVAEFLRTHRISEACQAWMRATALGGVTGTLEMTMWELFHRLRANVTSIVGSEDGPLFWNAQPPNSPDGFVHAWAAELERLGVEVHLSRAVSALRSERSGELLAETDDGATHHADAVFLAVPPPAVGALLAASAPRIQEGFGHDAARLQEVLCDSVYEHLGLTWFFDRPLPRGLPLGGNNVRRGWHPILVEHAQYRAYLRPPAVTTVVGSVSTRTELRHPRLGTRATDHSDAELARILWDDERRVDPSLPEPIDVRIYGRSSATQIVRHGPLPIRARRDEVYLATSLNGHAPYFTASLESAIQAGAAAAVAFDPRATPPWPTPRPRTRAAAPSR